MAAKNTPAPFNDDFVNLFNDSDMDLDADSADVVPSSVKVIIDSFKNEATYKQRFQNIQMLSSCIEIISPDLLEKSILQHLMPVMKTLLVDIFERINQNLILVNCQHTKSQETISYLQDHLQMCIGIQVTLDCILNHILQRETLHLKAIQSFPVTTIEMLLLTFEHCKKSDELYKIYFDDFTEIVKLFKSAQVVHGKLLKLMVSNLQFNFGLQGHMPILTNFLNVLCNIGEILVDMNIKALADTWKAYMAITQKFTEELLLNFYDVSTALNFVMSEVLRNFDNILNSGKHNSKNPMQFSKISTFFVKVLSKLYDIFWPNLQNNNKNLLEFLISIYGFYPPVLKMKEYNESTLTDINVLIDSCVNPLLEKALTSSEFVQRLCDFELIDVRLLLLVVTVFEKNPKISSDSSQIIMVIEKFFEIFSENYVELFWKIEECKGNCSSLYDMAYVRISNAILSLPENNHYNQIEFILIRNILQSDSMWKSVISIDIWCSILKQKGEQLTFETLINAIALTEPILHQNLAIRPETVLVQNLLYRFYSILPASSKISLIEKYPPCSNLHIWKCLELKEFPSSHSSLIELLLVNVVEKVENLKTGKFSVHNFQYLCHAFEAISTLETDMVGFDFQYLLSAISKLWAFEVDVQIKDNHLFSCFLRKLCCVTGKFSEHFHDGTLLMVLTKVKQLLDKGFDIHIHTLKLLDLFLSKSSKEISSNYHQINSIIPEILCSLLSHNNPIIKQKSLELFIALTNSTRYDHFIRSTMKNNSDLQRLVTNFVNKKVNFVNSRESLDDYRKNQKTYSFKHKCPHLSQTRSLFKMEEESDLDQIKARIKNDVTLFLKTYGQDNNSEKCFIDVSRVLSFYANSKC